MKSKWDVLRREVYKQYEYKCGVCEKTDTRLSCHEIWDYNDTEHIQTLTGFIALCDLCHHCKHLGLAGILARQGKLDIETVINHYREVNNCTLLEFQADRDIVFRQWEERNKYEWVCDISKYIAYLPTTTKFTNGRIVGTRRLVDNIESTLP